jgi:hypothetical protein
MDLGGFSLAWLGDLAFVPLWKLSGTPGRR